MLGNFVVENANNPGTGTFTLAGAPTDRRTFAQAFASGAVVYYAADDGTQFELGYGTITSGSPSTLTRNVISNSLGTTAALNFTGALRVYSTLPAERAVWAGADNTAILAANRKLTGLGAGNATDHAPRLDQVGWERIASTIIPVGGATGIIFSLPSAFSRFRLEFSQLQPSVSAGIYFRFSQDGGTTYLAGSSDYSSLGTQQVSGTVSPFSGQASYVLIAAATVGGAFGVVEFDAFGTYDGVGFSVTTGPALSKTLNTGYPNVTGPVTNILVSAVSTTLAGGRARLLGGRFA